MEMSLKVIGNTGSACGGCSTTACGTCVPAAPPRESPLKLTREERRVDLDTTIAAMDLTAREMNTKYKETSEGGLAVSLVLC